MRPNDNQENCDLLINIEAEREVIGTLLIEPKLSNLSSRLRAEDFSENMHTIVWRAMGYLLDKGERISYRSVSAVAGAGISDRDRQKLEEMSDRASGTSDMLLQAVDGVVEASRRRELASILRQSARFLQTKGDSVEMTTIKLVTLMDKVMNEHGAKTNSGDIIAARLKDQLINPTKKVASGITKLDHILGDGFDFGRTYAFIAKYKTGKTTLAATFVDNMTNNNVPVTMISLERQDTDIEKLIAARRLDINAKTLETKFSKYSAAYDSFASESSRKLVNYHHQPGASLEEICNVIVNGARSHGSKVAILDYYQIVVKPTKISIYEHLSNVAQTFANLTNRLNIVGIIMSQADAEGLPRDCKNLLHAASACFAIRRAPDQVETFFENLASNYIEQLNAGNPNSPAALLDKNVGPHFRNAN